MHAHANELSTTLGAEIRRRVPALDRPLIVGLDGQSGAGKSTLAAAVAAALAAGEPAVGCTVIEGDDFYGGGSKAEWDERSAAEKVAYVIDWRRQGPVLAALRGGIDAAFHAFDWQAFDGRLAEQPTVCPAADVVILEGAYSCRPELHEHLDLRVLLAATDAQRFDRLGQREGDAYRDSWFARWSEAETLYFGSVMPPAAFDMVLVS